MEELLVKANKIFWDERFWLPKDYDWHSLAKYNHFEIKYSLIYPILLAFGLYIVRVIFEKYVGRTIGRLLRIEEEPIKKLKPNLVLETYFKDKHVVMSESIYLHLSREIKMSVEDIKEWFTIKKLQSKPSKMKKFTESSWRLFFYFNIWCYGLYVLFDKEWLWNTRACWQDYPKHLMTDDIYWYYMIELGFYLSLMVTQFFDIRRKDFWQMFIHHLVTISLIYFSYMCNFSRIGSLVLVIHDCSDIWLELSKMALYANFRKICDIGFVIFALSWFITRLTAFPFRIIYSILIDGPQFITIFPSYILFNILLYILQVMHVIWFYMICRIAYKALTQGTVEKDDRSESDYDESSADDKKD